MPDVASINDLLTAARALSRTWPYVWWRGHTSVGWHLVPKVFRAGNHYTAEHNMIFKFQARGRSRHSGCPRDEEYPAWLSLMQHYGLPTRLLDWTMSVLVAAYFAVEGNDALPGAVWALNPADANRDLLGVYGILIASHEKAKELYDDAFDERLRGTGLAAAVIPSEVDQRMLLQQSMFSIHGSQTPLEELIDTEAANAPLRCFRIPAAAKGALRNDLALIGIRRSTLFPDLASLAQDIAAEPND